MERTIGTWRVRVPGYGALFLSVEGRPPEARGLATLGAALDCGVTLIDTADAYCLDGQDLGHNERLVAEAVRRAGLATSQILIATKGGHTRPEGRWDVDGRPAYLRRACEASIRALGVEAIDLYQFHRPDPKVPFEESIGALADLQREGKVRMVGISNVSLAQIDAAQRIVPIASMQNEYNLWERQDERNGVLRACVERGIAYLAYSPLGGGGRARRLGEITAVASIARRHGATPHQVALAWLLAKSPALIPIPCSTRVEGVRENCAAGALQLDAHDLSLLDALQLPAS